MTLSFIKHYSKDLGDILLGVKLERHLLIGSVSYEVPTKGWKDLEE